MNRRLDPARAARILVALDVAIVTCGVSLAFTGIDRTRIAIGCTTLAVTVALIALTLLIRKDTQRR